MGGSILVGLRDRKEGTVTLTVITMLVSGFLLGVGAYRGLLSITNQDTVERASYVLKRDLTGNVLKDVAIREIERLIKAGASISKASDKVVWELEVLTFIQGLQLNRNYNWNGQSVSGIEANIRWAMDDPSVDAQTQKLVGILKGFRSALLTHVDGGRIEATAPLH